MIGGTAPSRLLVLSEIFPPKTGGSGRWFWEIYRRLPRERVQIAAGECPGQEQFDREHDLSIVRIPLTLRSWGVLSVSGLLGYSGAARRLRQLIRAERVGMIHCGRCLPEGFVATWIKWTTGTPFLCYVHGEDIGTATDSRELSWLTRRVLGAAKFLIANSYNTACILREEWGLAESKVRILHPGVDTSWFVPVPRDPATRTELGWGDRPIILTVGRLQRRKGHDQMIRALSVIRSVVPDVLYAIVGDGEERYSLSELAAREKLQGHVQFLGELDDRQLLRCYQQCDLFVLPNRRIGQDIEGFGMVLLEAQACGKPVLAGASGGTAETMKIPETGRVVPCEGPDKLAALVIDLLSDRRRLDRMGQAARQWTVEQFDWESMGRQAEHLFWNEASISPYPS